MAKNTLLVVHPFLGESCGGLEVFFSHGGCINVQLWMMESVYTLTTPTKILWVGGWVVSPSQFFASSCRER